jgi:hypothetical protein
MSIWNLYRHGNLTSHKLVYSVLNSICECTPLLQLNFIYVFFFWGGGDFKSRPCYRAVRSWFLGIIPRVVHVLSSMSSVCVLPIIILPKHGSHQCVPGALSLGAKQPQREVNHSPPSSAETKNAWSCTSTPPIHLNGVVHIR